MSRRRKTATNIKYILHLFADVAQCLHRLTSSEIQLQRNENVLLFDVKTCSQIKVQLRNAHIHLAYELNFASYPNDSNTIRGVANKKYITKTPLFTEDCNKKRQLWAKWENSVISGGVGFSPGTKEEMRLADKDDRYGKKVALANVLTEPTDENAVFAFYSGIWLDTIINNHRLYDIVDKITSNLLRNVWFYGFPPK